MRWLALGLLLVSSLACRAQDAPAPAVLDQPLPLPAGWSATPGPLQSVVPGREPPRSAAHEGVIQFTWEGYHTNIIIGPGSGVLRPAYVLTYQNTGDLGVAYRATAFLDLHGVLHIDARNALICGPQSAQWSPDSFAIYATGRVNTMDDRSSCQLGSVSRTLSRADALFLGFLHMAESLVNDGT